MSLCRLSLALNGWMDGRTDGQPPDPTRCIVALIQCLMAILSLVVAQINSDMYRTGLCGWISLDTRSTSTTGRKKVWDERLRG